MFTSFELRLLGGLDLRAGDGEPLTAVLRQPKRTALLVYLALGPGGGLHRRDSLLGLLWPEMEEPRARNALNTSIFQLRKALGGDAIVGRGDDELGLQPNRNSKFACEALGRGWRCWIASLPAAFGSEATAGRPGTVLRRALEVRPLFCEGGRTVEVDQWTVPLPRIPDVGGRDVVIRGCRAERT